MRKPQRGIEVIADPFNFIGYKQYMSEIGKFNPMSKDKEIELFNRLHNGDESVIDIIVKHNLKFVVSVAKTHQSSIYGTSITLEDLISEGNIGLIMAVKKFKPEMGYKFISYAVWWINQQIVKSIKDNKKNVRLTINNYSDLSKVRKIESKLEQIHGRNIDETEVLELAKKEGVLNENVKFGYLSNITNHSFVSNEMSLTDELADNIDLRLIDVISDNNLESILETIKYNDISNFIEEMLDKKTPARVKKFFIMYYGLDENEPMTYKEIGDYFNVTGETVRGNMNKFSTKLNKEFKNKIKKLKEE